MRTDAGCCESSPRLNEIDAAAFSAGLGELINVYAAAMRVPAGQLPGRRAIMAAHAGHPAFRAITVTLPASPASGTAPPAPGSGAAAGTGSLPGAATSSVAAFGYGFRGATGQWWHDMVRTALTARAGTAAATAWLGDSFEIAELHVRPEHQRRGIGRQLLFRLTEGRTERTAVLSTMDTESGARRLYRSLGFTDLLTGYRFIPSDVPYAVMGVTLPLRRDRS